MNIVRDTNTVLVRELRPTLRDPFSPIFSMAQPLIFLALYGPLLSGMEGMGEGSPWQWFVPGILVMMGLFATSMTGSNLLFEMQTGAHPSVLIGAIVAIVVAAIGLFVGTRMMRRSAD